MRRPSKARLMDLGTSALAALIVLVVLGAVLGLVVWFRVAAPCWVFSVAEAPVRCLR